MKTELKISERPLSVSYVGIQQLRDAFGIQGKKALVIGSGKTAVLALRYLYEYEIVGVTVCSRNFAHAKELLAEFPGIEIVDIRYSYDDEWVASKIVEELLELYPELTGIYITGHGVKGVCQTLQKLGRIKPCMWIANDFLEKI